MNRVFQELQLPAIEQECWSLLEQSVSTHKGPFHLGVVATTNDDVPDVRTVVLRRVEKEARKLFFHTDIRSPKVQQLMQLPQLCWLFYDEALRVQLRIRATAALHTVTPAADRGWEQSRQASRLCYSVSSAPGTRLQEPELLNLNRKDITPEILSFSRSQFAVVETTALSMDWVFLNHKGNRRAFFDYVANDFYWKQV